MVPFQGPGKLVWHLLVVVGLTDAIGRGLKEDVIDDARATSGIGGDLGDKLRMEQANNETAIRLIAGEEIRGDGLTVWASRHRRRG